MRKEEEKKGVKGRKDWKSKGINDFFITLHNKTIFTKSYRNICTALFKPIVIDYNSTLLNYLQIEKYKYFAISFHLFLN